MKTFLQGLMCLFLLSGFARSQSEPYTIELEQVNLPGSPAIHSFAFAQSNGKWLFIGGRINGLHGFDAGTAFPKQYSNKNIFVVNPSTSQTWSRSIFTDLNYLVADPLRSTNMQFYQDGNKLFVVGGYGYDSLSNSLVTFSSLTVFDIEQTIQAVMSGTSISPYVRQINDERLQVCGANLEKLGQYFYLVGGHKFTGYYNQFSKNDQVYTDQIRKFKINDDGITVNISDYSAMTDTSEYHRRDMNVVHAMKPDGVTPYLILYGGVFKHGADLPFLNPVYIESNNVTVDYSFSQKMSQYTCALLSAYNANTGSMSTTFFGGMSVYYYNEVNNQQEYDSLVPFIDDVTTLTRNSDGSSVEVISPTRLPALLGTNAKFIPERSVPHFDNDVIKLNELSGRTFAGYIFGGIRAFLPNNTPSFPSEYIMKVFITPLKINVKQIGNIVPSEFDLSQNYPNPFNPVTKIKFSVPAESGIQIVVYDGLGKEVSKLVDNKLMAGAYEVDWDGSKFSSGVFYYQMTAAPLNTGNQNAFVETKKMLLIR